MCYPTVEHVYHAMLAVLGVGKHTHFMEYSQNNQNFSAGAALQNTVTYVLDASMWFPEKCHIILDPK